MKTRKLIATCMIPSLLAACGNNNFSGSASDVSRAAAIKKLNDLAKNPDEAVTVHFDRIDQVQIIDVSSQIGYGCATNSEAGAPDQYCRHEPPPTITPRKLFASISGAGSLKGANDPAAVAGNLVFMVSFDPTIANGQTCLAKAQNALIRSLQFDLKGKANLIPVETGTSSPPSAVEGSPGTAVPPVSIANADFGTAAPGVVGQIVEDATEVKDQKIPQPIFVSTEVGVVFNEILDCSEGGPAITPPTPRPEPEPVPHVERFEIHLNGVTGVTRADANSGGQGYISGRGSLLYSNPADIIYQFGIQLADNDANAECFKNAHYLMTSGSSVARKLEIKGEGWTLPIPMLACQSGTECPNYFNLRLNTVVTCKVTSP